MFEITKEVSNNMRSIIVLVFIISFSSITEVRAGQKKYVNIYKNERSGVINHKKGNYKKAYKKLSVSAESGLKQSQYLLGFMYLKGQYVKQSVKTGMAWLGVSNEVKNDEWSAAYDRIYNMLTIEQKALIDKEVDKYIRLYGMQAQNINCKQKSKLGSRNIDLQCKKRITSSEPVHGIEPINIEYGLPAL